MGATEADFQMSGSTPWSSDAWKIRHKDGAISLATSLRK